jgi:hypothetical protein
MSDGSKFHVLEAADEWRFFTYMAKARDQNRRHFLSFRFCDFAATERLMYWQDKDLTKER